MDLLCLSLPFEWAASSEGWVEVDELTQIQLIPLRFHLRLISYRKNGSSPTTYAFTLRVLHYCEGDSENERKHRLIWKKWDQRIPL